MVLMGSGIQVEKIMKFNFAKAETVFTRLRRSEAERIPDRGRAEDERNLSRGILREALVARMTQLLLGHETCFLVHALRTCSTNKQNMYSVT